MAGTSNASNVITGSKASITNLRETLNDKVPLVKKINLDLDLAQGASFCMFLKTLIELSIPNADLQDPTKVTVAKTVADLLRRIRQQFQYTIHARPADINRDADDITSDRVHNLEAHALGRTVYTYNAFVAPWIGLFKTILPYDNRPILGLAGRLLDFIDNAIGKVTNMFWNLRRISKGMIAYDGGITSVALANRQSDVRDIMSYYLNQYIFKPFSQIKNLVLKAEDLDIHGQRIRHFSTEHITRLKQGIKRDYINNIKAFWTKQYSCVHEGGLPKPIGSEEPDNHPLYVRSKILSQIIGLPIGIIGSTLNATVLGLNGIGSLFNNRTLRSISDKCTDYANALMSIVYMTGEVPANVNEFAKKLKKGINEPRHLIVAAIGALGMLNRMKILPMFSSILQLTHIKEMLDTFDKPLQNFFLLFFSANRFVIHKHEMLAAKIEASSRDLADTSKHDNLWSHIILPLRILFQDKAVSYIDDHRNIGNFATPTMTPALAA